MLKSSNHWIGLLLATFFLISSFGLSAVAHGKHDEGIQKSIHSPVEIPFVVENSIEILRLEIDEGPNKQFQYFQISGLLNRDVEDRINGEIEVLFQQMMRYSTGEERPPYRGIMRAIPMDREVKYSYLTIIPLFNFNHVLSVVALLFVSFPENYFHVCDVLNFDLTTGERISIQEVFTDDVDGLGVVNDAIVADFNYRRIAFDPDYSHHEIFIVAPFQGITEEQKFYMDEDGLQVIIDFNNPTFDVGFSYTIVTIPLYSGDGQMAITQRFYDKDQSIFVEDRREKRFLRNYYEEIITNYDYYVEDNMEWDVVISYPEDLSQHFIERIGTIRGEIEERIHDYVHESSIVSVQQYIDVYSVGPYVNISSSLYFRDSNYWEERNYVFSKDGKAIELGDVFVEGFDYVALLQGTIDGVIQELDLSPRPEEIDLLDGLMFKIHDTSILFMTRSFKTSYGIQPLFFDLHYRAIGYEHLALFNER